jgi:hypothetical protein
VVKWCVGLLQVLLIARRSCAIWPQFDAFISLSPLTRQVFYHFEWCPQSFFLFFAVLGFELRAYTLSPSTSSFCDFCFFHDRVLWTIFLGWLRTAILLISTAWIARIIGVSHWCPDCFAYFLEKVLCFCPGPPVCLLCSRAHTTRPSLLVEWVSLFVQTGLELSDLSLDYRCAIMPGFKSCFRQMLP